MKQRTALLIAAAMTSFLLVAAGGILASAATAAPADAAGAAVPVTETAQLAAEPQPAATSDLEAQREAEYKALLQQANERIQQANQRITALTEQLQQAQQPPAASPAQAPEYAVSPDLAAAYALQLAPGATLLGAPELVDFQGTAAYEVRLDRGNLYIDATTGRVVYDGVNMAAGGSSERESEHEREQESDHDGDDD
jgi:uncharacterized membrane protein YkoI